MPSATPPTTAGPPVAGILATLLFLLPALGVPSPLIVQDTLKSALLACGVLIAALLWACRRHPPVRVLHLHTLLLIPTLLFVYALGSMLWSHPYMAGADAARWLILGLLIWVGMQVLTRDNAGWLLAGIHCGAVVASVWAALQFWGNWSPFPQGPAPASTFYNRNFFAEYAVCALPFSVWWMSTLRSQRALLAMALSIALQINTIGMTGTRSALLTLLLLLPLMAWLLWRLRASLPWPAGRSRHYLLLTLLLGLLAMGQLPASDPRILQETPQATPWVRSLTRAQTMTDRHEYATGSMSLRTQMWLSTLRMVQAQPWRGVGAGAWEIEIPRYQNGDTNLEIDYYAHNEYLQLLSEYGLPVGGLALALLLAGWIHAARSTVRLVQTAHEEAPGRAFSLLSLLALAVVSGAGFPWHLAGTTALMGLSLAWLCASDIRLATPGAGRSLQYRMHRHGAGHRLLIAALIGSLGLCAYLCQRAFRAEERIVSAILLADQLPRSPAPLTTAQQDRKARMLETLREGIALHPHYRKFSSQASEVMLAEHDWAEAAWILQSVADSHPHIAVIWQGLALAHAHLRQPAQALDAVAHLKALRPDAPATRNLEVVVLSTAGEDAQAKALIERYFAQLTIDYDMAQTGYILGIKLHDQALAVQALELRNRYWPQQMADGYFRIGTVYDAIAPRNPARALQAFALGLHSLPATEQDRYLQQVPARYRAQLPPVQP